ncbi:MAG: RidA family protein [Acidobacteria bacterium]|nr:RidA family protein [Acidobacteriota bacterium]
MRKAISTTDAPQAIGPYSQAIRAGTLLFASGQIPIDPVSGAVVAGDIAAQTRRVFDNIAGVLKAAGGSFEQVVKTTVFLADMNDFAAMNAVYSEYFNQPAPARSTVQVARLPRDVRVEIEIVADLSGC